MFNEIKVEGEIVTKIIEIVIIVTMYQKCMFLILSKRISMVSVMWQSLLI